MSYVTESRFGGRVYPYETTAPPPFSIGAFEWSDGHDLPPRQWLYGLFLARRVVSVTIAAGGTGKSSLAIAEALAMAAGRALLHDAPVAPLRVAVCNLEDELMELRRRIAAAAKHHGIAREDIADRLFVNGAENPFVIATQDKTGARVNEDDVARIVSALRRLGIDVLIVDPFVSSHAVQENDNGAMDMVIKAWARVAREANCAVHIIHHARKANGGPTDIESSRGASSLIDAARSARVLNFMTKDEAERHGVTEGRLQHVRIDNGKSNFAALGDADQWVKIESVPLMNGLDLEPEGDFVGVMTAWHPPKTFDGITTTDTLRAQEAVAQGGPWRQNPQADQWVGKPIAEALGWNPFDKASRARLVRMINTWIKNGALVVIQCPDENRKLKPFVEVGQWAR